MPEVDSSPSWVESKQLGPGGPDPKEVPSCLTDAVTVTNTNLLSPREKRLSSGWQVPASLKRRRE